MCKWNCHRLAEALAPLLPLDQSMEVVERVFQEAFDQRFYGRMRFKLGLLQPSQFKNIDWTESKASSVGDRSVDGQSEHFFRFHYDATRGVHLADSLDPASEQHRKIIDEFFVTMAETATDFTNAFRGEWNIIIILYGMGDWTSRCRWSNIPVYPPTALALVDSSLGEEEDQNAFLSYILSQCATVQDLREPYLKNQSKIPRQQLGVFHIPVYVAYCCTS